MRKRLEVLKVKADLYEEMRQCRSKREGQGLAIDYYKKHGILTRQGCKKWLQYIKGWSLPLHNKAQELLVKVYRKNLISTIDYIEYAKRLNGFYSLDIIKKLESLLGNNKGQANIFGIVGLVYLGLLLIVLLVIF